MDQAIKLAIEKGGYESWWEDDWNFHDQELENKLILDPLFWQALARAKKWSGEWGNPWDGGKTTVDGAYYHFLVCMDLVYWNGDTEKFWQELLT